MSIRNLTSRLTVIVATLAWLCAAPALPDAVIYVDDDAPPGGNGQSWATAFRFLQDALAAAAASGGTLGEIRIAQGTYTPDRDEAHPDGTGDRQATFELVPGSSMEGGYAGLGAPDPDARDVALFETILSGDLVGDDGPEFTNYDENNYHVVYGARFQQAALLDGLTLTAGNANGGGDEYWDRRRGGGAFLEHCGAAFNDCLLRDNWAWNDEFTDQDGGAGVYAYKSEILLLDCAFISNLERFEFNSSAVRRLFGCAM